MTDAEICEAELSGIKLDPEQECSLLSSVLVSIIRDLSIAGVYGYRLNESAIGKVPISEVFYDVYAENLKNKLMEYSHDIESLPLYSGEGDFLSFLSRILLVCNENSEKLSKHIDVANENISKIGLKTNYMKDKDYIRHMRNAVAHCNFNIIVDSTDWEQSQIVFLDVKFKKGSPSEVTAKITITNEQFLMILKVLTDDVLVAYLKDSGWMM